MNWTTLLRFRKQVEDMAREAVVLTEWEKKSGSDESGAVGAEMESVRGPGGSFTRKDRGILTEEAVSVAGYPA